MQNKRFLFNWLLCLGLILGVFSTSCAGKKIYAVLPFNNFTRELDSLSSDSLNVNEFRALRAKHGRFFQVWLMEIMDFGKYGRVNDTIASMYFNEVLKRNKVMFNALEKKYGKYETVRKDADEAFGRLQEMLPDAQKPVLYAYFSQFSNYNTFVDTVGKNTILAFSSEMFMGDTFVVYKMLEVPDFFNRYNASKQIVPMLVWNYLKSRYESQNAGKTMLDEAIFNGCIWYTMQQVFPDKEPWELFGYTQKEWTQMRTEEGQIWRFYLSSNTLFSTDFNGYKRFFNYGMHTFGAGIPPDCPPLIGSFSGLRIVESFQEKKKEDLKTLWQHTEAAEILRLSGYNPIK